MCGNQYKYSVNLHLMEYKYAASAAIYNLDGEVLLAQRSLIKFPFPGAWSLPSTYIRDSAGNLVDMLPPESKMREQLTDAIRQKLGLEVVLGECIGAKIGEQNGFVLSMTDYIGKVVGGELKPNITDYADAGFFDFVAKVGDNPKGFCTQVLMDKIKENADFWRK